jgi:signal transduction histidine kinase
LGGYRFAGPVARRVKPPKGIPIAVYFGAIAFVAAVCGVALAQGGSSLPLVVQGLLVLVVLYPWTPTLRRSIMSPLFAAQSLIPIAILTWTGGSYVFFAVLAISASRAVLAASLPRGGLYVLAAIAIVVGRGLMGHPTDWWLWTTYIELGAVVGIAVKHQQALVRGARQAGREHAQIAAVEERRRIARDVHDVLAHTLTILMVHLNSARLLVHDDPDATAEVLDEVATYGRRCLEEIRRTVGLLSEKSARKYSNGPVESAEAIEELVDSYRKAGIEVNLRLDVGMERLRALAQTPPEIWHVGYRIAQESLANAVKHAPGVPIELWIRVGDTGLHITCTNSLKAGVMLELPRGGNGIVGMRERVQGVGGSFSAQLEDHSWVVQAELPLSSGDAFEERQQHLGRAS